MTEVDILRARLDLFNRVYHCIHGDTHAPEKTRPVDRPVATNRSPGRAVSNTADRARALRRLKRLSSSYKESAY